MRTEDDIRRVLDLEDDAVGLARLTDFADTLSGLPPAVPMPASRRRVLPLLAAAAVVVLVAGGGVALVQWQNDGPSNASDGSHTSASQRRPTWNLRVGTVHGYTFRRVSTSSIGLADGSQVAVSATRAKRPEQGDMTTCPGTFHYCVQPSGKTEQVAVNGRTGVFTPARALKLSDVHEDHGLPWQAALDNDNQPSLAFYAGHRTTVFLHGTFGFEPHTYVYDNAAARKTLLRIADAVSAGHHDATLLPFALNGLPGRVAPERVSLNHGACGDYGTGPRSVSDPLGTVFTACRVRTGATDAATIAAADRVDSNRDSGSIRFEPYHPVVHDYAGGTSLVIAIDRRAIVSPRLARDVAAHADVSPGLGDPSSWIVVR